MIQEVNCLSPTCTYSLINDVLSSGCQQNITSLRMNYSTQCSTFVAKTYYKRKVEPSIRDELCAQPPPLKNMYLLYYWTAH